ncbi:sh3 and multiple ankyrin repeat domains protein 1, partial [Lasius niger]
MKEKEIDNLNHQFSQAAIVDHLKRLTREIATIKYDMRQALSLLDILVEKRNKSTECVNTKISFEGAESRFPLETKAQLAEVEEILKTSNSQDSTEI